MRVSLILDADEHIKSTIEELRESVSSFDYEFVVVDRGSGQRLWLSQQGDIQLLTVNDTRDVSGLLLSMARHEDRIIYDGGVWRYRHDALMQTPPAAKKAPKLRVARHQDKRHVLHLSSFPDNTSGITAALAKFGDIYTFDWKKELNKEGGDRVSMNKRLIRYADECEADIIFMEECFTGDILPASIRSIKTEGQIAVVNWCGDIRAEIPASMLDMAPVVDWTLLSNEAQVHKLESMGFAAGFLPAGCDTSVYAPGLGDREQYPADIVFLGSRRKFYPLDDLREQMAHTLNEKYGDRFRVYGRGWPKRGFPYVHGFVEPQAEEAKLYNSCKLAIGISAFDTPGYTSARMWKAMGSGACYLPYYFQGVEKWFVRHEHLAWWKTIKELITTIDYFLARENDRIAVARAGQIEVHRNHSWDSRMETVMRLIYGRKIRVF